MRTKLLRQKKPHPEIGTPPSTASRSVESAPPESMERVAAPSVSSPVASAQEVADHDDATAGLEWAKFGISPGGPEPISGWLVIVKGSGKGRFLPIGYGIHTLGRGDDQRIRLNFGDRSISRQNHTQVTYDGENRCFYASPGNGTKLAYLNGHPILQVFALKRGDRLRLGDTELAFVPFCGADFDWQAS